MQDEATCEWHLKLDHNSTGGNRAPHDHPYAHLLANIPLTIRSRSSESLAGVPLPQPALGDKSTGVDSGQMVLFACIGDRTGDPGSDQSLLQRSFEFGEGHLGWTDTDHNTHAADTLSPDPLAATVTWLATAGGSGSSRRKSTAARPLSLKTDWRVRRPHACFGEALLVASKGQLCRAPMCGRLSAKSYFHRWPKRRPVVRV